MQGEQLNLSGKRLRAMGPVTWQWWDAGTAQAQEAEDGEIQQRPGLTPLPTLAQRSPRWRSLDGPQESPETQCCAHLPAWLQPECRGAPVGTGRVPQEPWSKSLSSPPGSVLVSEETRNEPPPDFIVFSERSCGQPSD